MTAIVKNNTTSDTNISHKLNTKEISYRPLTAPVITPQYESNDANFTILIISNI